MRKITYKEIPAPDDQCYKDLWPEIIGTNCWICTSHKQAKTLYRKIMNCPDDMVILHKCDRGSYSFEKNGGTCINPLHLKIGTQQENQNDRKNKITGKKYKHNINALVDDNTFVTLQNLAEGRDISVYKLVREVLENYVNSNPPIEISGTVATWSDLVSEINVKETL